MSLPNVKGFLGEDDLVRISELSRRSGVPVATIKFYLRERLLPEGVLTSATQAQYDEQHLDRLRLIRSLVGVGGLSVARARDVVQAIDSPPESLHRLFGEVTGAVRPQVEPHGHDRVHTLMQTWGWEIDTHDEDACQSLVDALDAIDDAGFTLADGALELYRRSMTDVAEFELDHVPDDSVAAAVRYVVLGSVLVEPLLLALRRLAQQQASARRFGTGRVS